MTEAPQWFGDADALAEAVVREVGTTIAIDWSWQDKP